MAIGIRIMAPSFRNRPPILSGPHSAFFSPRLVNHLYSKLNSGQNPMRYKSPVNQKQSGKNYARYTVGGHESKVHAAQIVRFNHAVLIDEHNAEKYNADVIWITHWRKESREHNKDR